MELWFGGRWGEGGLELAVGIVGTVGRGSRVGGNRAVVRVGLVGVVVGWYRLLLRWWLVVYVVGGGLWWWIGWDAEWYDWFWCWVSYCY